MRQLTLAPVLLLPVLATSAVAVAQDTPTRPKYSYLRFNEDWSVLRDAEPSDPWDSIKYIPLGDDHNVWMSLGGHARIRLENWSSFAFGAPANDNDTFLLWRLKLHADVHVGDSLRFFVEGKTAGSTDRDLPGGRRTLDVDSLELQQAFADIVVDLDADHTLVIRPGRQELLFGKQRLVSPLPWGNSLRHWDGVSAILRTPEWTAHGFWTQFAPVRKYDFNQADAQTEFFGVYASRGATGEQPGLDLYALGLHRDDPVTFNGTTGTEERYTLGGRLHGPMGGSDLAYDLEAAYQFGSLGVADIDAWMVAGLVTMPLEGDASIAAGVDYASGDDAAGGDVGTFNHLFPLGHAYFGYIDIVGRQNIVDTHLTFTTKVAERTTLAVAGHSFWRADDADALYNAGGGVVRAASPGASDHVGIEVDLTIKHVFGAHLAGLAGYSHFFAGDFIEDTGSSEDIDFVYVQLQYTF